QPAAATGVRLTLTDDTAPHEAARQPGAAVDPSAPAPPRGVAPGSPSRRLDLDWPLRARTRTADRPTRPWATHHVVPNVAANPGPGSAVAAASAARRFDLDWQLRERTRTDDGSTGAWVTDQVVYNVAGSPGTVDNTVALDGTRADGSTARDTDADAIQVVNPGPAVTVAKTVTTDQPVYVPEPDTPAAERPAATWTLTARTASVAAAGHVRVTDPAVACLAPAPLAGCQTDAPDADPFTGTDVDWLAHNPFRYVDLTAIRLAAGIPDQVDLDATVVWLLHHDGAGYRTSAHTGAQAVALDASALADVVGVSVTFQAHDAGAAGAG